MAKKKKSGIGVWELISTGKKKKKVHAGNESLKPSPRMLAGEEKATTNNQTEVSWPNKVGGLLSGWSLTMGSSVIQREPSWVGRRGGRAATSSQINGPSFPFGWCAHLTRLQLGPECLPRVRFSQCLQLGPLPLKLPGRLICSNPTSLFKARLC